MGRLFLFIPRSRRSNDYFGEFVYNYFNMELRLANALGTQFIRRIYTSPCACGKKNFKKFPLYNKRGTKDFKIRQSKNPHPEVPIHHYGVRPTGVAHRGQFSPIEGLIPQLVVPDLTGFKLQPYVSHRAEEISRPRLTPEELFGLVYVPKISEDFTNSKLGPDNEPLEPSPEEKLSPEEARARALQVNSDIV